MDRRGALGATGALLALVVLLVGCGGGERRQTETTAPDPPPRTGGPGGRSQSRSQLPAPTQPPRSVAPTEQVEQPRAGRAAECGPGALHPVGSRSESVAAVARRETVARRQPNGDVLAEFGPRNANGHATVFAINGVTRDGCGRLWYRVSLPMRPNGSTGYVPAGTVRVFRVDTRVVVDLSDRQVTLLEGDEPVIRTPAAIGALWTPTPTGRFYVNQRLVAADPTGPWGPGAIGISAFSDVLQEWSQGGPIAIHGTDDPKSIGLAASHGCIRVPNRTLLRLFDAIPAGTPVLIRE